MELLLLLRQGLVEADVLVDIKGLAGSRDIRMAGDAVSIGATATHREIAASALVSGIAPTLAAATSLLGNIRVRTQGTLGGNLCFADPHSDPATPLLLHDASVIIRGTAGDRRLSVEEFSLSAYQTALDPAELLTEIVVPPLPGGWHGAFARIERLQRPTLNAAAAAHMRKGEIVGARLVVGCVGETSLRLRDLERRLVGMTVEGAAELIGGSPDLARVLAPVDDLLGSAAYKLRLAAIHLTRTLRRAAAGPSAERRVA